MPLSKDQIKAKQHLITWKVGALFMEPGTGKTRAACEIINSVPDIDNVFWIAPLAAIRNTKESIPDEINKWGGVYVPIQYIGIESIQSSDRIYLGLLDSIMKSSKPFVVIDESLKIKNKDAKRTKRMFEIGKIVEYKLILNGTPFSKNLLDLWSQMEFISPLILNMTFNQFKNSFCEYKTVTKIIRNTRRQKEYITGYENIDYLYSLIRNYIYECDLNLNISQNYKTIRYELCSNEKDDYNHLKERYLDDEMLTFKNNNIFIEMTQKMQHSYCCTESKFIELNKLFGKIEQKRTIIYCKFIASRKECEKMYPQAKVLSYQKESLGLNLQEYNHTVYFDKIWDLSLRIQSGRRTFRTGQEYDCYYYDFTGDVGLESMIDKNIQKKISMTEYFKMKTKEEIINEL